MPLPMRKLFLVAALVPCALVIAGCPKKADPAADAEADAAAAPVVVADAAPVAPVAKNVNDVARFPAEKPLTDDDQKTIDLFSSAKTACKAGNQVALVKAGTDTFKIAEFQDCVLVTFPDPKDATTNLMGWIPKDAYTRVTIVDAGVKEPVFSDAGLRCPNGQEAVINITADPRGTCRKKCKTDQDCRTKTAGMCAVSQTTLGKSVTVCAGEGPNP